MSDLIARIERELECKSWDEDTTKAFTDCKAEIERLSAPMGEPVAYRHWCECDTDENGNPIFDWEYYDKASCSECQPLYTAPPSVDALITEIDILGIVEKDGSDWLNFYKVQAILDKYRSAK